MTEKQILLVRHPQTEANVTGRWVGRGNTAFTQLGEVQVDAIAEEIVAFDADRVWSSPLERALVPATAAAHRLGLTPDVDERLVEMSFGVAEGLTLEEAQDRGIRFEFEAVDHPVADGGESRGQVMARSAEVFAAILSSSDRPAVVTHGGVFRSAIVDLLGMPIEAIWSFHIRNAQIAVLSIGADWARVEEFRQAAR